MASISNFQTAVYMLERVTSEKGVSDQPIQFEEEYKDQHLVTTALKILNHSALFGTDEQKAQLLKLKTNINCLNNMLRDPSFSSKVKDTLGIEMGDEAAKIKGLQIGLPLTKFEKMVEVATKIPRIFFTVLIDVMLFPVSLLLILAVCCKVEFNPKIEDLKYGKTPILLLHGSNFNESEWVVGREFLKKEQYGSVFSLNYDGLVSNDPKKGIEDYARDKISAEVKKITSLTGSDRVILIGHSMGGMIAGYYAENCAENDKVNVEHVISIATPWQGAPLIDWFWKLGGQYSKRYRQMSLSGGTDIDPNFRKTLVAKALDSERKGLRKYYNIWSTTDCAVPSARGCLTEDPRRQRSFSYLGHYAIVAWPNVWLQNRSWLNEIYASEASFAPAAPVLERQLLQPL